MLLQILVIENEIGAVSIDHDLLPQEHPRDGVVVLQNGCMCCSGGKGGDDLERALDRLTEMRDYRVALDEKGAEDIPFDTVIIECTGLADPAPILQALALEQSTLIVRPYFAAANCKLTHTAGVVGKGALPTGDGKQWFLFGRCRNYGRCDSHRATPACSCCQRIVWQQEWDRSGSTDRLC